MKFRKFLSALLTAALLGTGTLLPMRTRADIPVTIGDSVSVKLGSDYAESGMSAWGGDGAAVQKTYDGVNGLETCPPWPGAEYIYANVGDSFISGGTNAVYIALQYYDGGAAGTAFSISYDGASSAWKGTAATALGGTDAWKTVTYAVPDAKFANSENGADFRIDTSGNVCFSQITVTKCTGEFTPASISASPSSITIGLYGSPALSATVFDQNGAVMSGQSVTWTSGDASVVTVDGGGRLTAVAPGTATVTAACGSLTSPVSVTVSADMPVSVVFGGNNAADNGINVWTGDGSGYTVDTYGGVTGWQTKPGYGVIYGNVSDSYIYGGHHKVEVAIEYYDAQLDGKQDFGITYDSLAATWASSAATTTYLTGTNTWKTATYVLDDAKFANGENGADFRIFTSDSDVCIHSVTVTRIPILTMDGGSAQPGNIFTSGTTPAISLTFGNQFDTAENLGVTYQAVNSAGSDVADGQLGVSLAAGQEGDVQTVALPSLPKGTYRLKAAAENGDGSQTVNTTVNFSVITDLAGKDIAQFLGQNHVPVDCYQSENQQLAWIFSQSGATRSRAALVYLTNDTSQSGLDTFVQNVKNTVTQDDGKIQYFEVGNESNSSGGFSARQYFDQLKLAYAAVKSVDPNIKVVMGVAFGYDANWLKAVIDLGGLDYSDAVSFHLYSGLNPEQENLVADFQDLHDYILGKKPGSSYDLLLTETGYATQDAGWGGMSELTSAAYAAQLYVTGFIHQDLIKEIDWYDFMNDGTDPTSYETNGGIIRADYTAKPSFVAFNAAASELAGAAYTASYNTLDQNLRVYKFHRSTDNKDVYAIWSNGDPETVSLNLGSGTALVGDMFGNFSTYAAVNGAVTLNVAEQPVYVEGSFSQAPTLSAAAFTTDVASVSAAPGDDITIHVNRSADAQALSGTYAVTLPAGWTLESGGTFEAGSATDTLVVAVPDTAAAGTSSITIVPRDDSGNSYAALSVSATIIEPSVIQVQPEVNADGTGYMLAVNVTNKSGKLTLSGGKVTVLEPTGMAGSRTFSAVAPDSTATVTFPFSSLSAYTPTSVKLQIDRDDGTSEVVTRSMTSLTAVKADTAPTIDGTYDAAEWANARTFELDQASQAVNIPNWTADFLSATGYVKWDDNNLYLDVKVTDPTNYNTYAAGSNWMGDSVQFSIDPGRGQGYGVLPHTENNIALRSDGGGVTATGGFGAGGLSDSDIQVTRDDATNTTNYEMAISWTDILPSGMAPYAGMDLGFSLLVNDNNGTGRLGWIQYMSGIGAGKDPTLYGDLILAGQTSLNIGQASAPASISVSPSSVTVTAGSSQAVSATVFDQNSQPMSGQAVVWTSADPTVAAVDSSGNITGVTAGTTTVTAACGSLNAAVNVTVTAAPKATTLEADPCSILMAVGAMRQIKAAVYDQFGGAFGSAVSFTSSNPSVASVAADGTVTAGLPGFTVITVTGAGLTAKVPVTVPGGGTTIARVDSSTAPGSSRWFDYNSDNKYPFLSFTGGGWWSDSWAWMYTGVGSDPGSNPDHVDFTFTGNSIRVNLSRFNGGGKANVYLDGTLIGTYDTYLNIPDIQRDGFVCEKDGLEDGQHTVSVAVAGKSVSGNAYDLINAFEYTTGESISVPPMAADVLVDLPSATLPAGGTATASAAVVDQNGQPMAGASVAWSSSDESVATVDANGVVTAVAPGTATITAASGGVSGSVSITVSNPTPAAASVTVTAPTTSLSAGGTTVASAAVADQFGQPMAGAAVTWSSSDESVATVDANGVVTAVAPGTAVITAMSGNVSGTLTVTVSSSTQVATSIWVAAPYTLPDHDGQLQLAVGGTVALDVAVRDSNGQTIEGAAVTWSSSDESVATVDANGVVTAVAAGAVFISAASGGVSRNLYLDVPDPAVQVVPYSQTTAMASSVNYWDQGSVAANAVNGNLYDSWSSDDNSNSFPQWISVDLGQTYDVSQLKLTNIYWTGYITGHEIWVSENGTDWTKVFTGTWNWNFNTQNAQWVEDHFTPVPARYVKLVINSAEKPDGSSATISQINELRIGYVSGSGTPAAASVTVTAPTTSLSAGGTIAANAAVADQFGQPMAGAAVAWSSSDENVATVDANGVVTAVAPGTAVITAMSGNVSGQITVTVHAAPSAPASPAPAPITVTGTSTAKSDGTTAIQATIPASGTNTSTVSSVSAVLGNVTVTVPASVLNDALGGGSSLSLIQSAPSDATQKQFQVAAGDTGLAALAAWDIDLTRSAGDGTSAPVHDLNGNATVSIRLTAEQLIQLKAVSDLKLCYYDPSAGTLSDMGAVFDLAAGTVTFTTKHFSTYVITSAAQNTPIGVLYASQVQKLGWLGAAADGALSGTTGKSLRDEAVTVRLTGTLPKGASIVYQSHVQKSGWLPAVSDGAVAGTAGKALRLEALRITLKGLTGYAAKYRVYVQSKGWLGWVTTENGTDISKAAVAGTTGKGLRIEALEIQVVKTT